MSKYIHRRLSISIAITSDNPLMYHMYPTLKHITLARLVTFNLRDLCLYILTTPIPQRSFPVYSHIPHSDIQPPPSSSISVDGRPPSHTHLFIVYLLMFNLFSKSDQIQINKKIRNSIFEYLLHSDGAIFLN